MSHSSTQCILVCVTNQKECERLIDTGKKFAEKDGVELHVISVIPEIEQFHGDFSAISTLYEKTKSAGAEMTVYFNDEPVITAAAHAKKFGAVRIIAGLPGENSSGFLAGIRLLTPDIELVMVDQSSNLYRIPAQINV